MMSENRANVGREGIDEEEVHSGRCYLQKFKLYETRSKFYMIGRDKIRSTFRVLKIDRLEASDLNILEDSTIYSEIECQELLKRIDEGNKATGGLKFVTNCYGIIGFVKFLGPSYMLIITRRRKIGAICGHIIYAITKSEMIPLPNSTVRSNMGFSKNENRYKKLLCTVDLTKDFFFSYSYHIMRSLQTNLCSDQTGQVLYETMFVWNEFLTRGIRSNLKNTIWTVALVYGFFKQAKLSVLGRDFKFTLIARRSRHFAGTRFLKRGVNEKGRVANDVETEQIIFEDVPEGYPMPMSSVVQNRGSIPLFWSQETSRLNLRPDIVLLKKDSNYEATKLHFDNLMKRYGNPIIVLNLIKTYEKKRRESVLKEEFESAIKVINSQVPEDCQLKPIHWDLNHHSRSSALSALNKLGDVASDALQLTGYFYYRLPPVSQIYGLLHEASFHMISGRDDQYSEIGNGTDMEKDAKELMFQKGVLRTNCIDCLDRTNVAQYAYGLVALGQQLTALGFLDNPKIQLDDPLADDLMGFYEKMGDVLALQYGGSAAHNKIFSERRGQWKPATQSQEFFRTLQRYCSNAYLDAVKQDAINVFLGHFQPQHGRPALWELDSDQHYSIGRCSFVGENSVSFFKRSMSDGNILCDTSTPPTNGRRTVSRKQGLSKSALSERAMPGGVKNGLCDSTPDMGTCENDIPYSRITPLARRQLFADSQPDSDMSEHGHGESLNGSTVGDVDWLSSSGNSCEDDTYERSTLFNSPLNGRSSENVLNGVAESAPLQSGYLESLQEEDPPNMSRNYDAGRQDLSRGGFSDRFMHWVEHGTTLFN